MRLLLDTHALIWWWIDSPRLSGRARSAIGSPDNEVFVSSASVWEIAIKWHAGKLAELEDPEGDYQPLMAANGFIGLAVTDMHAMKAGLMDGDHRDPFDRLIAAQALIEGLTIVTRDKALATFGCDILW